ncbi:MAG TPA: ribonuclease HII, partial [bacterium]|nr:ribonuclease HII [bacterium]
IHEISVEDIDKEGIGKAVENGIRTIIEELDKPDIYFLVDGRFKNLEKKNVKSIIGGDDKVYSIGAASICAKVFRDRLMMELGKKYSEYGFENHVGYGTKKHSDAIKKYGVTEIHRRSFKPIKNYLSS